jgi:hypothetical protein
MQNLIIGKLSLAQRLRRLEAEPSAFGPKSSRVAHEMDLAAVLKMRTPGRLALRLQKGRGKSSLNSPEVFYAFNSIVPPRKMR